MAKTHDSGPGFIEAIGEGDGPKSRAARDIIAAKQAEMKSLADELTDAYQASLAHYAGTHMDEEGWQAAKGYPIVVDNNIATGEYTIKIAHAYEPYIQDEFTNDDDELDEQKSLDNGYTLGKAYVHVGSHVLTKPKRGTLPENITHEDHGRDDILPDHDACYQQYRSTSLSDLLAYMNQHIFAPQHRVDASKYLDRPVGSDTKQR